MPDSTAPRGFRLQVYTPCNGGKYCDGLAFHEPKDTWIIRNKYTPDKPNCNACIVKDGPLPLGTHTWKLSPTAVGKPKGTRSPNHSVLQA